MLNHPLGDGAQLRPLEPWRAAEFAACIERDREHLAPWLPWAARIVDADGARAWLQTYADKLVTRACRVMIDWAFEVRGLSRVEWRAVTSNVRSLATARRLGMVREGVLRAAVPGDDGRQDLEVWAVVTERAPGAAPPPAGR
ncbi:MULTISPECIES: GNAT family protein [unclassified Pseudonocardia]|jgi:hypothetical protein|uniref:GNAT family N-acetyltransferase n=1 Tax=unclassified Pseudonocardia TaxID=2619320 RepID=UPI000963A6B9|nr:MULTISPECIES: GNAT family protein [unclassified Pseudonocardia]MBN9102561.1 GNAT family N-acetyltransferase [Pseudonocardia sp.]OJY46833.1 MAG: hypothetical protein BGP03_27290 [Pseudonocardia sp. 73-21]